MLIISANAKKADKYGFSLRILTISPLLDKIRKIKCRTIKTENEGYVKRIDKLKRA